MQTTAYFSDLLRRVTRAVEEAALKKIKDRSFWWKEGGIGPMHCDFPIFSQSKELKRLGGVLKTEGGFSIWYQPKGSHLYNLVWGKDCKQLYFLLCLKDGREALLKQTPRRIALVDRFPPFASRQFMLEFFEEFHGNKNEVEKIIRKVFKTGGYK